MHPGRALLWVAAVAAATAAEIVNVETTTEFEDLLATRPLVIARFQTSWSVACEDFEPTWKQVAEEVSMTPSPIALATIDAEELRELTDKYDVIGYPTVKIFYNGGVMSYEGQHNFTAMMKLITNLASYRPPQQVFTPDELKRVASVATGPVLLGLFRQPVAASAAFKTLSKLTFDLTRSGGKVTVAYSASYTAPPVVPPTPDGGKPSVPGLMLLDSTAKRAVSVMPMPRKRDAFTVESISRWLNTTGRVNAVIAEEPNEFPEKDYTNPDEDTADDEEHDHDGPYDD